MKKTVDPTTYFQKITDYVRKRRISPMLISSSEGQILLNWKKKGIPPEIVIHSIDIAYEKYKKNRTKGKRGHFNLKSCKSIAVREWKKYLLMQEQIKAEKTEWNKILEKIRAHLELVKENVLDIKNKETDIQNVGEITDKIIFNVNSIQKEFETQHDVEKVIENLKNAENQFIELIMDNLHIHTMQVGKEAVEKKLKAYKGKIDMEALQNTRKVLFYDWIKEHLQLKNLSIKYNALLELFQ